MFIIQRDNVVFLLLCSKHLE